MNPRLHVHCLIALALVWCATQARVVDAQMSIDGRHDIAALIAQAQTGFNMAGEDAVLLFDGQRQYWLSDGRLVSFVHRIVRVNTDLAMDAYGDNRIPYDAERCTLQVVTVRTWRDGQWWETGPSGKVETLPFAVREAYDYTNMREMMLLHNGVEVPSVLELAYIIEDKVPFRGGADGMWLFARPEPAVQSSFALGVPRGTMPRYSASVGVPEPTKESDERYGVDVYSWNMLAVKPLRHPQAADAEKSVPHITWSTWSGWSALGRHLDSAFESAVRSDGPTEGKIDSVLRRTTTAVERAERVARFIIEKTRYIDYPERYWWPAPRMATQTYATAYGHRLDRAILAAALFRRAGLEAQPVFLSRGYGLVEAGIPSLAQMAGVGVWVKGDNLDGFYDPESGEIANGAARVFGRTIWNPGIDAAPSLRPGDENFPSVVNVRIDLRLDTAGKVFAGTGYLDAGGCFSPFGRMVGQGDRSDDFLGSLASGIITDAKVSGYSPLRFDPMRVEVSFTVEVPLPQPDSLGRLRLVVNDPPGGIPECLPGDVRLFHQRREAPVSLPGVLHQHVECQIDLHGVTVVYRPVTSTVENAIGKAQVAADVQDSVLVVSRDLKIGTPVCQPQDWPSLRALLLANRDDRARTILLKQ